MMIVGASRLWGYNAVMPGKPDRPIDSVYLADLMEDFLVECPQCRSVAKVAVLGERPDWEASLYCESCGKFWKKSTKGYVGARHMALIFGHSVDPYFHLPLWLQAPCCGSILWAYNRRHLQFLEDVVGAKLRKTSSIRRCPTPLSQRLPRWMLDRKHRDEVLRGIKRLKAK
jgi:hypothetical protein